MPFEKQLLPRCPACGEPRLMVIESRPTPASIRRRKQCEVCGHRVTTHEITEDAFNEAKKNASVLVKLRKLLQSTGVVESACLCYRCKFSQQDACVFDLPEYQTEEARDCNLFEAA